MKVEELLNIGFKSGKYMISKIIWKEDYEGMATIEYRPGINILIDINSEIDFNCFSLCIYGDSSCPSAPIKIKSIDDLKKLIEFF